MYLFEKFRNENPSLRPATRHPPQQQQQPPQQQQQPHRDTRRNSLPPMPHTSRPILAIDTAPPSVSHRQPQQQQTIPVPHREVYSAAETRSAPAHRTLDPTPTSGTSRTSATARKSFLTDTLLNRPKYIFMLLLSRRQTSHQKDNSCLQLLSLYVPCRLLLVHIPLTLYPLLYVARKLKCDGGRPTCGQCLKRSNACDYQPQNKRRGTQRPRKGEESGSESGADISPEVEEPSLSPEVVPVSQPTSRRSSNVGRQQPHDAYPPSLPPMSSLERDSRRDEAPVSAPPVAAASSRPKVESSTPGISSNTRRFYPDNEVPQIATLPISDTAPPTPAPMSAPSLPPIRPASEQQALQRKRAATVPGKSAGAGGRQSSGSGPKVVACNFCRGEFLSSW